MTIAALPELKWNRRFQLIPPVTGVAENRFAGDSLSERWRVKRFDHPARRSVN